MSKFSTLKLLSDSTPKTLSQEVLRRTKLVQKLQEQKRMADAEVNNSVYSPTVKRRRKDTESGTVEVVEQAKRLKPWWFATESGKLALTVRYGSHIMELGKGKYSIEVAEIAKLPSTIDLLIEAVLAGELDSQINSAADSVSSRFKH